MTTEKIDIVERYLGGQSNSEFSKLLRHSASEKKITIRKAVKEYVNVVWKDYYSQEEDNRKEATELLVDVVYHG